MVLAAGALLWKRRRVRAAARELQQTAGSGDEQYDAMLRLYSLQERTTGALVKATSMRAVPHLDATGAFEQYFALSRELLAATVAFNDRWEGSFDVQTMVAQPFAQQLSMAADHADAVGDRGRAQAYREEAQALVEQWVRGTARAEAERSEAVRLAAAGEFNASLLKLDALRADFLAAGQVLEASQTALNLANLYEWLGDEERALEAVDTVKALTAPYLAGGAPTARQVEGAVGRQLRSIVAGSPTTEGEDTAKLYRVACELLSQEGRLRRKRGDLDEAERLLRQALPHAVGLGVGAGIEFHLAGVALERGRLDEAAATLARIAPDFESGLLRPRRPALRMLQSDVRLAAQDPAAALADAESGIADLEVHPDLELGWKLCLRRGRALRTLQRPDAALESLIAGAHDADTLRKSSLGYRLDTCYLRDKLPLFEAGIDLAVARDDGPAAARLIELVKSRALAAALSVPAAVRHERTPDELQFDELSRRVDALDYVGYAEQMTVAQRAEREALLAEREAVIERIRVADPRWRALSEPVPVDVEGITGRLRARGAAALTLFHRPGRLVAVLLSDGEVEVGAKALSAEVEGAIEEYAKNLRRWEPDPWLYDLSEERGVTVADLVPRALFERTLAAGALVIVPHGPLHLVPWAGLQVDGDRLLERCPVSVVPNLTCLTIVDGPFAENARIAVIGDPDYEGLTRYPPLEHAGDELAALEGVFGSRLIDRPCAGPSATESRFWELATDPALAGGTLHVACHATLESAEPLQSGLLLSGSKVDAGELAQCRLTPDELVLSACSTGWRPQQVRELILAGDDALGLPAAALEAGARAVVVSITKAADEPARDLAVAYHRKRRSGLAPAAALNAAQRELFAAGEHEPWTWIGMTAYGW
jgi:CHAT domain-containing protein